MVLVRWWRRVVLAVLTHTEYYCRLDKLQFGQHGGPSDMTAEAAAGCGARIVVRQIDPELLKKMGSKAERCDVTNIMYGGPCHD